MRIKICLICVLVSGLWLILSAGIAWSFLAADKLIIPISLLMGGTVIGISDMGPKRLAWANRKSRLWKLIIIVIGFPLAYLAVTNISVPVVIADFIFLLVIASLFFIKREPEHSLQENVRKIEKQMEECC